MSSEQDKYNLDLLVNAFLYTKDYDEVFNLLSDLCTPVEIKTFAQRIAVAKMLNDNSIYNEIVGATGASTATVSRVKRSLHYGTGFYKVLFERMDNKDV